MGILRTDKVSGLETPTAVTGSVEFDGSGDWITTPESEDFNFGTGDLPSNFGSIGMVLILAVVGVFNLLLQ